MAYDQGRIAYMRIQNEFLITIGNELVTEPIVKVWKGNALVSRHILNTGHPPFPVSAFSILPDLSQVAIGFSNGTVILLRGDLTRDRGAKQRVVFDSQEPITGLEFVSGPKTPLLYIVTTTRLLTLASHGKGHGQPARVLDSLGAALNCTSLTQDGYLVIVRDDAVYFYKDNTRGPCYAFEGPKSLLQPFNTYLAVVTPSPLSPSDPFGTPKITLLDTENKFIAHVSNLPTDVKHIFSAWGDLHLLLIDGSVLRLEEKDMSAKLEILYRKHLYMLAINLAQAKNLDSSNIVKKYGDHLYSKGDYDSAMQQYIKCIHAVQPSLVIRKYLDSQRIHNLTSFLEELHNLRLANSDHTTLLLNCYAKLKDADKLQKFITSDDELKFDLDTAIVVCRQAGFSSQAAYLAKRYGQTFVLLSIMIEDLHEFSQSLDFIRRLDPDSAFAVLEKYGKPLLDKLPHEVTELYIDLYTGKYKPQVEDTAEESKQLLPFASLISYLPYRSSIASSVSPPSSHRETLEANNAVKPYQIPSPRSAFAVFVDHPSCFVSFLEACLEFEPSNEDVRLALFEGYLNMAKVLPSGPLHAKAKDLLSESVDASRALLISYLCDFTAGKDLIRERSGLKTDIFYSYAIADDVQGAISALKAYGTEEPELYPLALTYFTSSPETMEAAGHEFVSVLRKIEQDGLMAPLQVVQVLSRNAVATIGSVKAFLSQIVDKEKVEIENNRKLIESYKADTLKKRAEIKELEESARVFQVTRCFACGGSLELPVVHYLCKHSFHQRCINEDSECPQCAPANAAVRALVRAQDEMADRTDLFSANVAAAQDKFKAMLEFPGVLNMNR